MPRTFQNKRFPVGLNPSDRGLVSGLRKANKELERQFGDNYYGMSLVGSHALGYAREHSPLDVLILGHFGLNHSPREMERVLSDSLGREWKGKGLPPTVRANPLFHEAILRAVKESPDTHGVAQKVLPYFSLTAGKRINEARREVLAAIRDRPDADRLWWTVQLFHKAGVLSPSSDAPDKRKRFEDAIASRVPHLSGTQLSSHLSGVLSSRNSKFGLPPLERYYSTLSKHFERAEDSKPKKKN